MNIRGVFLIEPKKYSDERGYFMETFRQNLFCENVSDDVEFVQENQSFSTNLGTIRGLHYQKPPFAQGKLVRCLKGRIIDVAVDIRKRSPTYGQHVKAELSSDNNTQLWIPPGFLHGFATQEPNTLVTYKCTNYYSAECDENVLWNDTDLGIDWQILDANITLSDKDANAPIFSNFSSPF
jgi:dTDP-4-dehydrorhamnose 3,5-epimerase